MTIRQLDEPCWAIGPHPAPDATHWDSEDEAAEEIAKLYEQAPVAIDDSRPEQFPGRCWVAECDPCREDGAGTDAMPGQLEEFVTWHFSSEEEARQAVVSPGGLVADDGRVACGGCAEITEPAS